jgi:ribosome maturation protein SDO1
MDKGFMPPHEKLHINLARLRKEGVTFEVPIHVDNALLFREGHGLIEDVVTAEHVFEDAHRGVRASEGNLKKAFNSTNALEIAAIIVKTGEIQLTAEFRKKRFEEKQKQIIDIIHRNGVDPRTKLPHPPDRILRALEETKIHIDEHRTAQEQVKEILKALMPILPIAFEMKEIEITIPQRYASAAYPKIKHFGRILKNQWESNGSWYGVIEIPGGMEIDFYETLNASTHGCSTTRILKG